MALKNQPITVCYTAYDAATGLRKTGDAANHTIYVLKDGVSAPSTNGPVEPDGAHAPGEYSVALTAAEMNANTVVVTGKSSTAGVEIVPVKITTERGVLPTVAPATSGGMPTVDASNHIAGIAGTKNTLDSLNDLSSADVAALGLDAPVSSRLAAASYIAPDNADIAAAAAGIADILTRLTASRAAALDNLAHLDADVSSRLGSASYTAPDNAGIAAIVTAVAAVAAKTANLPANPAAVGDAMTLDMTQAVPVANTPQTIGDALNGARVNAFGNWVLLGTTYTLYAPDGTTPVHSFTLNDVNNPTSRV